MSNQVNMKPMRKSSKGVKLDDLGGVTGQHHNADHQMCDGCDYAGLTVRYDERLLWCDFCNKYDN